MELLYYWIQNDRMTFEKQGFNFSNRFNFEFSEDEKVKGEWQLTIEENQNFIPDFFDTTTTLIKESKKATTKSATVLNVTAIIGKNGTGKSNLLEQLIGILTNKIIYREVYLLAFLVNGQIEIWHSLEDAKIKLVKTNVNSRIKIKGPTEEKLTQRTLIQQPIRHAYVIPDSAVIYLNPSFDLRNYPPDIEPSSRKYIDMSTSALIYEDKIPMHGKFQAGSNPVLNHKYANNIRLFDLAVINSSLAEITDVAFPKEFIVAADRSNYDESTHFQNNVNNH